MFGGDGVTGLVVAGLLDQCEIVERLVIRMAMTESGDCVSEMLELMTR